MDSNSLEPIQEAGETAVSAKLQDQPHTEAELSPIAGQDNEQFKRAEGELSGLRVEKLPQELLVRCKRG